MTEAPAAQKAQKEKAAISPAALGRQKAANAPRLIPSEQEDTAFGAGVRHGRKAWLRSGAVATVTRAAAGCRRFSRILASTSDDDERTAGLICERFNHRRAGRLGGSADAGVHFWKADYNASLPEAAIRSRIGERCAPAIARRLRGGAGSDLSEDVLAKGVLGKVTLVSCSSSDIEYKALLRKYSSSQNGSMPNPLHDFTFSVPQRDLQTEFVRGGFPVNFDGSADPVPASKIQVTRGLLLAALLQASLMTDEINSGKETVMLDPTLQRFVVNEWFQDQPRCCEIYSSETLTNLMENPSWIAQESNGRSLSFSTPILR